MNSVGGNQIGDSVSISVSLDYVVLSLSLSLSLSLFAQLNCELVIDSQETQTKNLYHLFET